MQRLYIRDQCPCCHVLKKILNKKIIKESITDRICFEPAPRTMIITPTLIDETGKRYEGGEQVKAWLETKLAEHGFNVEEIMNPHHSEFHRGNKRFLVAMLILVYFLRQPC